MKNRSPRFGLLGCLFLNLIATGGFLWEACSGAPRAEVISSGILAFALLWNTLGAVVKYRELTGHDPNWKREDLGQDEEGPSVP